MLQRYKGKGVEQIYIIFFTAHALGMAAIAYKAKNRFFASD
jgi:hypothetical protein